MGRGVFSPATARLAAASGKMAPGPISPYMDQQPMCFPAGENKRCLRERPRPFSILLLALFFLLSACLPGLICDTPALAGEASPQVVPPRVIQPKVSEEAAWFSLWTEARNLTRDRKLAEAARKYQLLLQQKNNLEPAQWELVQVLLQLERFPEAVAILEVLLELNPDTLDYLEALANIMMAQGHSGRAAELLRRAHELSPDSTDLLEKLCKVLAKLGNDRETLPYLEKLFQRRPTDLALRNDIARLYYALGQFEKARGLLVAIAESGEADAEMLKVAARVHDRLGLQNLAAGYWKRVLTIEPGNREGRDRLIAYYEQEGQGPEALEYLLALLREHPEKPELLKRIGQIYVGMKKFAEALPYLEGYILRRSGDKEVLRLVIDIHVALGNRQQSMAVLDRFFAIEKESDLDDLRRAAKLYEEGGRYEDAARAYDKILKITPDDMEILARQAWVLLAAGKDDTNSAMWMELARRKNLLQVLEELHRHEPSDQRIVQRLAFMYADMGLLAQSRTMFEKLTLSGNRDPEVLKALAELYVKMDLREHALTAYEDMLAAFPERTDIILPMISLAGKLGLVDRIWRHWAGFGYEKPEQAGEEARIVLAVALTDAYAGGEARTIYQTLAADGNVAASVKIIASKGIAETYWQEDMPYEAEQALREALAVSNTDFSVLRRLFEFSLARGRYEEAAVWLGRLRDLAGPSLAGISEEGGAAGATPAETRLLRSRLLFAEGQNRAALKLVQRLLDEFASAGALPQPTAEAERLRLEAWLTLCRFLLGSGKLDEAEQHCLQLVDQFPQNLEVSVLLSRIYMAEEADGRARQEEERALALAAEDFGRLLQLAALYREQGAFSEMVEAAEIAVRQTPDSLRAKFMLAEGLELQKKNDEALRVVASIEEDHPHLFEARVKLVKLLMKSGRFAEALQLSEALLAIEGRADLLLVKARILWEQKKWDEALEIYEEFRKPSAEQLFADNCKTLGIVPPPAEKRSLWEMVSSGQTDEKIFLDRVMQPDFVAGQGQENHLFAAAASPLYGRYRWQEHFDLELRGRRAVVRREYFAAVKYFEDLVKKFPEDVSLQFDLAGVYSRLGALGKEEAVYDRIAAINAGYPGLAEASQRNRLKLQPRGSADYGYRREEGREGYKALRSEWQGASFWLSPRPEQEMDLSLKRITYRATDFDRKVKANRAEFSYNAGLGERLGVTCGGGFEALESGHPDAALAACGLEASLGDRITGTVSFKRDLMHDTTASITRGIIHHDVNAAAAIDLFPAFSTGGQYTLIDYSDNNVTDGYDLWAAYILLSDPVHLEFKYRYDFKESDEGTIPGDMQPDGFGLRDHPYWAPQNYWQNQFSLFLKHQFSDELYDRGVPSYIAAEYSVFYDSRGYAIQTWSGEIFFEVSQHLIVEAATEVTSSQEYRDKSISLGVVYRW